MKAYSATIGLAHISSAKFGSFAENALSLHAGLLCCGLNPELCGKMMNLSIRERAAYFVKSR
jgi:hypothetical protein